MLSSSNANGRLRGRCETPEPAGDTPKMIKVGLTGGIGSGKSLACEMLGALGAPVIDADEICRELTAPGGACTEAVRGAFGDRVAGAGGALKRDELRRIVFSDDAERERLEAILHPAVRKRIRDDLALLRAPYCVVSVPLLVESNFLDLVDMTVVLDCPEPLQAERAGKRGALSRNEALVIIEKQAPRAERLAVADVVIDNSGDKAALRKQLVSLHETLMRKAANNPG